MFAVMDLNWPPWLVLHPIKANDHIKKCVQYTMTQRVCVRVRMYTNQNYMHGYVHT